MRLRPLLLASLLLLGACADRPPAVADASRTGGACENIAGNPKCYDGVHRKIEVPYDGVHRKIEVPYDGVHREIPCP